MWWKPRTADEQVTADALSRLAELFASGSQGISAVHGVGSTTDEHGRRVPMLVLDISLAPRPPVGLVQRLANIGRAFLPLGRSSLRQKRVLTPLDDVPEHVNHILRPWDLPRNTRLFFSAVPVAASLEPGTRVWAYEHDATIGFSLEIGDHALRTTAGHLVAAVPCPISVRTRKIFQTPRVSQVGAVFVSHDPTTESGVDIALIEDPISLDGESPTSAKFSTKTPSSRDARLARPDDVLELAPATLAGGRSGRQRGWVNGALQATRTLDGRIWKNCWTVMEIDGGFAQPGDSGGPVITSIENDPAVLGHLVAVLGIERATGRFQCGLVQDVQTIVEYLATAPEVTNRYSGRLTVLKDSQRRPLAIALDGPAE